MEQPKEDFVKFVDDFAFAGFNVKRTPAEEEKLWGWQNKAKEKQKKNKPVDDTSNPPADK